MSAAKQEYVTLADAARFLGCDGDLDPERASLKYGLWTWRSRDGRDRCRKDDLARALERQRSQKPVEQGVVIPEGELTLPQAAELLGITSQAMWEMTEPIKVRQPSPEDKERMRLHAMLIEMGQVSNLVIDQTDEQPERVVLEKRYDMKTNLYLVKKSDIDNYLNKRTKTDGHEQHERVDESKGKKSSRPGTSEVRG